MRRSTIAIVLFIIGLRSFAADISRQDEYEADSMITLNVGGKEFVTSMSTLRKYPDGMLAHMFDGLSFMKPSDLKRGCYFLDDDPSAFHNILYFLRYNDVELKDLCDARCTRRVADKLCPAMVPHIDQWIKTHNKCLKKQNEKPPADITLTPAEQFNRDGSKNWFICKAPDGDVIGSTLFGLRMKTEAANLIREFQRREIHKDLCYSWSGRGYSIYNCRDGKKIGDQIQNGLTHEILGSEIKFLALNLIENIVRSEKSEKSRYVCTFNRLGTFSIFNVKTGKKRLADKSFGNLKDCVLALKEAVQNGIL